MPTTLTDRRQHTRYAVPSFYTGVGVRLAEDRSFTMDGHAYDLSIGGMRFELDESLEPGTRIVVRIELPCGATEDAVEAWMVFVSATVVWIEPDDLETHGPVRMACVFTDFASVRDREQLARRLERGRFRLAA